MAIMLGKKKILKGDEKRGGNAYFSFKKTGSDLFILTFLYQLSSVEFPVYLAIILAGGRF